MCTNTAVARRGHHFKNIVERGKKADKESEQKMLRSLTFISLIALHNTECFSPNRTTSQSSKHEDLSSENAIDGNVELCAHTLNKTNSWWTIDLLGVYEISHIFIYNKEHHNANITGAQIHIGNSRKRNYTTNSLCQNITNLTLGEWNPFKCNGNMSGRYITVFSPQTHFLVVCELKINATKKESPFELITQNKTWEDALYHCRERNMDLAPILDEEHQAWAELEAKKASTPFVWLALHYSCVLDYWFWVTDHRLQFDHWAQDNKTSDCDMNGAMDREEDHRWFSIHHEEKFYFICSKQCSFPGNEMELNT